LNLRPRHILSKAGAPSQGGQAGDIPDATLPPGSMILPGGHLTPALIRMLHENFGFSVKTLQKTVYRQIPFHKNAITLYRHVFFDAKCLKKSEQEWLLLIIHEQVHREEIGNSVLGALAWYAGYLVGFARAGFSYRKNVYEQRAYNFEEKAASGISRLLRTEAV
jgi:hypothetical protein